jgi:hypothetical protein
MGPKGKNVCAKPRKRPSKTDIARMQQKAKVRILYTKSDCGGSGGGD